MKYTKIPSTAFQNIQLNAGILTDSFTPATATVGTIIGATSGGVNFTATPSFKDWAEDVDNAPKNLKEFKKLESWEAKMTGIFVSVTADLAKLLVGAGDIDSADATHIVPRNDILQTDFDDIWWVGDYSDINEDDSANSHTAGFCAIHLINALSTGGFKIQSNDKAKGTFSFEFTGHYSSTDASVVPFEIYIKMGA